jgi:hypothetical protein
MKVRTTVAGWESITFSSELYKTLEQTEQRSKLSFVWVVRDAAEKYAAQPSNRS